MSSPDVDLTAASYQAVLFRVLADILDSHVDLPPLSFTWSEFPENNWRRVSFQLSDLPALTAWRDAMRATGPDVVLEEGTEPMAEPGEPSWDQVWFRVDGRLVAATEGTIQFWAPSR